MHYTYILVCETTGRRYIGHTSDLKNRLVEHNVGKCIHTKRNGAWNVKSYFAFDTLELARNFERYLKTGSGFSFSKRHFE